MADAAQGINNMFSGIMQGMMRRRAEQEAAQMAEVQYRMLPPELQQNLTGFEQLNPRQKAAAIKGIMGGVDLMGQRQQMDLNAERLNAIRQNILESKQQMAAREDALGQLQQERQKEAMFNTQVAEAQPSQGLVDLTRGLTGGPFQPDLLQKQEMRAFGQPSDVPVPLNTQLGIAQRTGFDPTKQAKLAEIQANIAQMPVENNLRRDYQDIQRGNLRANIDRLKFEMDKNAAKPALSTADQLSLFREQRALNKEVNSLFRDEQGNPRKLNQYETERVQQINKRWQDIEAMLGQAQQPEGQQPAAQQGAPAAQTDDKVIVEKDGKQYRLPRVQLQEAVKQGYKQVQ